MPLHKSGCRLSSKAAWADADHDGDLDLYVANHSPGDDETTAGVANVLWRNNGNGRFTDVTVEAGVDGGASASVGVLFFDINDDGDLDLVLLAAGSADKPGHQVFKNRGGTLFETAVALGSQDQLANAQGALAVDLDGGGGLELVVARAGAAPELWRAPTPAGQHWLEVLPGGSDQTNAFPATIGMQVEIKSGFRLQVAGIASSSGYLSGTPARAHFGLGQRSWLKPDFQPACHG